MSMLFFRNVGAVAIAVVACVTPELGPNRFWLAGIVIFVCMPAAVWLERQRPVAENGWSEPLFDLGVLVTLIHLVPAAWFPGLVIGLMIVQAPSVAESRMSFVFYALSAAILTLGMTIAAIVHEVPGWELPILAMVVLYPSIIFYAHRQTMRANEIRARAQTLEGLHLVAGGIAHDFNTVLTSTLGCAELARLEIEETHPARKAIDEVVSGAHRASLLSARLLAFSGQHAVSHALVDVAFEARALVALMEPVVPSGIQLALTADTEGAQVRVDRAQLQQVLMNLILNASEATEQRPGVISIELAVEHEANGSTWGELRVRDQGIGIPANLQPQVFDPLFTSKGPGRGLGWASARSILREFGGSIELASVEGEGTEVCARLPAFPAPASGEEPVTARTRAEQPGLALIVDDENGVRTLIARMLQRFDFEAIQSEDAESALALFRRRAHELDLVVLDLRMPGMDGWACLRELRGIRQNVPVILCSGYAPDVAGADGTDLRVTFLPKPFRVDDLRGALDRLTQAEADPTAAASDPS